VPLAALREAGYGTNRQFAVVQRYGRSRWNTGRSLDAAGTAAPDTLRTSTLQGLASIW
jgi:hypothetical protein